MRFRSGPWGALTALPLLLSACGGGGGTDAGDCSVLQRVSNGASCEERGSQVVPLFATAGDGSVATCTGAFVSLTSVLTAAHCVDGFSELQIVTPAGVASTSDGTISGRFVDPRYDRSGGPGVPFDTAVLRISFPGGVSPVAVASSDFPEVGDDVTVFGNGTDETGAGLFDRILRGDVDDILKAGRMRIAGFSEDRKIFAARFDETGQSACPGDSGGPAIALVDGAPVLVGVVSFGTADTCTDGSFVAFGNVGDGSVRSFVEAVVPDLSRQTPPSGVTSGSGR